jgi:hydroxymethylbilane synthase
MASPAKLRIATRGSPLALTQAETVRALLAAAHGLAADAFEIVAIRTSGDAVRDRPLADVGGKGLFTKEIEEALLDGRADLAVHSAKDVPTFLPKGLLLAACPERADPRDVFVGFKARSMQELHRGAVVGTASVRRSALAKRLHPHLQTKLLRGNVHTRLEKVESGLFDGTILALAGLKRLGLADRASEILDPEIFPPSAGQGAIAIEIRTNDGATEKIVRAIDHVPTLTALACERAFLAELDGSCRAPISGYARIASGRLLFHGLVISPGGQEMVETRREGAAADAEKLGADAGRELRARAPAGVLTA